MARNFTASVSWRLSNVIFTSINGFIRWSVDSDGCYTNAHQVLFFFLSFESQKFDYYCYSATTVVRSKNIRVERKSDVILHCGQAGTVSGERFVRYRIWPGLWRI